MAVWSDPFSRKRKSTWSCTSAAESHVDRSTLSPGDFIETNARGIGMLLDAARAENVRRFLLVSTDEVYGDIAAPLAADETWDPNRAAPMLPQTRTT